MKIWLDDIRPAPDGYVWCRSVNEVIGVINNTNDKIELIDCDHDLGEYARDGGDGIKHRLRSRSGRICERWWRWD